MTQCGSLVLLTLLAAAPTSQPARVTIRSHRGAPAFFIDGKPEPPIFIYQTKLTEKEPAQFRTQGYRLFSFAGNMAAFGMSIGWQAPDRDDYSEFDAELKAFTERVPDGFCIPRVWVGAPRWWLEMHPEEAVRFASGVGWQENVWGGTVHESFASQRWRREGGEAFRRFIRHICQSPYASHVVGIHIADGVYGEWHGWSPSDMPDTSEPMRQAFARFLSRKYNDVTAWHKAWNDDSLAAFDKATIPTRDEQQTTDLGMFRDPARRRRVIDYFECTHEVCLDDIEHFCRIAKEESQGRLLTQVFYGYLPDLEWPTAGDHRAGPRALRSPLIDILVSPHTYSRRLLGQDGLFRHFPAADILHGKLFLDEGDDCTYLAPSGWPAKFAKTRQESIELMRREFGNAVTHGAGMYYMDQSGTYFSEPELMAELGRIRKWADRSMDLPRESVAQVAVVSSLQSEFYTAGRDQPQNHMTFALYNQQMGELCQTGAPFDMYHVEDLTDGSMRPYRVYLFLDAFFLTDRQRAAIDRLKSDHRTMIWFYAPGFITKERLSLRAMEALTELKFDQIDRGSLRVSLQHDRFPDASAEFGFDLPQSPIFVPIDPAQVILGQNSTTHQPAFVSKTLESNAGTWRSIYSPTPPIPAPVLRCILSDGGVHIYTDSGDNLTANASWICLHSSRAGRKTIRLPRAASVLDACTDRVIATDALSFEQNMPAGQTGIWMLHMSPGREQ